MKFILQNGVMAPIVDGMIDHAKESAKQHIHDLIITFLLAAADVLKEVSYSVALIGGGICIIVWAVAGVKRAGKLFGVLVLAYGLIRLLLGG